MAPMARRCGRWSHPSPWRLNVDDAFRERRRGVVEAPAAAAVRRWCFRSSRRRSGSAVTVVPGCAVPLISSVVSLVTKSDAEAPGVARRPPRTPARAGRAAVERGDDVRGRAAGTCRRRGRSPGAAAGCRRRSATRSRRDTGDRASACRTDASSGSSSCRCAARCCRTRARSLLRASRRGCRR